MRADGGRRLLTWPRPRFLLGMGAQKAGTTWLAHYLRARKGVDLGIAKEYHFFDELLGPSAFESLEGMERAAHQVDRQDPASYQGNDRLVKLAFRACPHVYYAYFRGLACQAGVRLTGDISPSYAGLSADHLRTIDAQLARSGLDLRAVFIMRDPVRRLNSAARMALRRKTRGTSWSLDEELAAMRTLHLSAGDRLRSDYSRTVEAMTRALPQRSLILFYETMFCDREIKRLCRFLGLKFAPGDYGNRINHTKIRHQIPPEALVDFAAGYRPVYDYVEAAFAGNPALGHWKDWQR